MRKNLIFLSIALLFGIASCNKEKESGGPASLEVDRTEITASKDGGQESVLIKSNCYWDVEVAGTDGRPATWVTASASSGQSDYELILKISSNVKTEERVALVTISTPSSKELTKVVTVTQEKGEKPSTSGYSFPVCQTIDIDSPESRQLVNAVIGGNLCQFKDGMTVTWSNEKGNISFECPSHTQPDKGTEADKSIHRSLRFEGFAKGESIVIATPLKDALSGDVRLMTGARAASFTKAGWSYYWSNDNENWNKVLIECAQTPGSDAVWNVIDFNIPEANKVPAGGTLYFKFTADGDRSKTYVCISNSIYFGRPVAQKSTLPAMDDDKVAYAHGFDDNINTLAAYAELPVGWLRSATTGYASNYTSFGNQYVLPDTHKDIAQTVGCYERPGYLQVGYYDESLWTRQCIGTYTIKIGERLKVMGVSSTDAKVSFKAAYFKDFRGYDPLAKVYVKCGSDSTFIKMTEGKFVDNEIEFKNLTQDSKIIITCPRLTDAELAALGRGDNVNNLQDYRFYIDDVKVLLTDIHSKGASADGSYPDFNDGGLYKW